MKPITIATLPDASAQEVFDWIVYNLLRQHHRSVGMVDKGGTDDVLTCVYRSPEGYKCAAGWIIGDDEYQQSMENISWGSLNELGVVPSVHVDLISNAQYIHDTALPDEWEGRFAELGHLAGLNTLVVDNWCNGVV